MGTLGVFGLSHKIGEILHVGRVTVFLVDRVSRLAFLQKLAPDTFDLAQALQPVRGIGVFGRRLLSLENPRG